MQSNNPVFRNAEGFNQNAYGNATYAGNGQAHQGYGQQAYTDPSTWNVGTPGGPTGLRPETAQGPMTVDTVVQKTALTLGAVILAALATWVLTPDMDDANVGGLYTAVMIGSLGAFALSMVNSFKRLISPGLVIAFAVLEGVALGALSKMFAGVYEGVVPGAIFGTFAAFAGTLAAYKIFDIKIGNKFRVFVTAAVFGMVGLGLMSLVLGMFGVDTGLFGFGTLGMLTAIAGLVLGIFMLVMDFDFVEQGIANGLPERESWRAAFAMTVSLVWIYTNLLRLLAIFQQD